MKRRNFLKKAGAGSAALTGLAAIPACTNGAEDSAELVNSVLSTNTQRQVSGVEPTLDEAIHYWQEMEDSHSGLGWPDHMFDFNVLWNGGIVAKPDLNRRTTRYKDLGAFFRLLPITGEEAILDSVDKVKNGYNYGRGSWKDINFTAQNWREDWPCRTRKLGSQAPVLVSRWHHRGVILESSVFACTAKGEPVKQGDEPLYAWVRLSVFDVISPLPVKEEYGFNIVIEKAGIYPRGKRGINTRYDEDRSYNRRLTPSAKAYDSASGFLMMEDEDKVRMALAPGADCRVLFHRFKGGMPESTHPAELDAVAVLMRPEIGAHVDLLIPMLPEDQSLFSTQLAKGYDSALAGTVRFWESIATGTEAVMDLPESYLNLATRVITQYSLNTTELNPATGKYCKVQGSWAYNNLWATPVAMEFTMMLDGLGYHDTVKKYLRIFKEEQGTVTPPGKAHKWLESDQENTEERGLFKRHPGYLSTPALYQAIDWLPDNGAILYAFSMHGLLSGDKQYIEEYTPAILKSCEWIREARAQTNHDGRNGILPAGVNTDNGWATQSIRADSWNYLGLSKAVTLLQRIEHPRAAEFEKERDDYRSAILDAYYEKFSSMPEWTDKEGKKRKLPPTLLSGEDEDMVFLPVYVVHGPLLMVFTGLLSADDPTLQDTLAWFREGPQGEYYRRESTVFQLSILEREITSCVPMYSWNIFHSLQTGDREKFLTGLYSLWAGAIDRNTFSPAENRHHFTGMICGAALNFYLSRLALVDDFSKPDEIHLLKMAPKTWLEGRGFTLEKIPTEYGPVNLKGKLDDQGTLDVSYSASYHWEPEKVVLHVPPLNEIRSVRVNGKKISGKEVLL
ncbi:MAG: twin-arginine translocation signal domain-containing protein [Bacteroidota bacterium]